MAEQTAKHCFAEMMDLEAAKLGKENLTTP